MYYFYDTVIVKVIKTNEVRIDVFLSHAFILSLNLYSYMYYIHYTVIIKVIKTDDVRIDVFLCNSERTYFDT